MFSWLYDIKSDTKGPRFTLLGLWTLHLLRFENIKCVREIGIASIGSMSAYNFKNRLFCRSCLVETRRGWLTRKVLVTPKNADTFIAALKQHNVEFELDSHTTPSNLPPAPHR